jgi:hypothetical protein
MNCAAICGVTSTAWAKCPRTRSFCHLFISTLCHPDKLTVALHVDCSPSVALPASLHHRRTRLHEVYRTLKYYFCSPKSIRSPDNANTIGILGLSPLLQPSIKSEHTWTFGGKCVAVDAHICLHKAVTTGSAGFKRWNVEIHTHLTTRNQFKRWIA